MYVVSYVGFFSLIATQPKKGLRYTTLTPSTHRSWLTDWLNQSPSQPLDHQFWGSTFTFEEFSFFYPNNHICDWFLANLGKTCLFSLELWSGFFSYHIWLYCVCLFSDLGLPIFHDFLFLTIFSWSSLVQTSIGLLVSTRQYLVLSQHVSPAFLLLIDLVEVPFGFWWHLNELDNSDRYPIICRGKKRREVPLVWINLVLTRKPLMSNRTTLLNHYHHQEMRHPLVNYHSIRFTIFQTRPPTNIGTRFNQWWPIVLCVYFSNTTSKARGSLSSVMNTTESFYTSILQPSLAQTTRNPCCTKPSRTRSTRF